MAVIVVLVVCLAVSSATNIPASINEKPIVVTALGKIQGRVLESRLGTLFHAFRGIRYARPPVENLRFKPPESVNQWSGVFDATEDGPMCPQPSYNLTDISEDCLRINIYTRDLSQINRRPVIFYIHPGAFAQTSGQSKYFAGPQNFMDRDVVLVTINYRLGALGFLSTGTGDAPGNNGLKDQVMALKWVKLHIGRFGGDPNTVTIMGYSAGAISVTLHMVSPMSRGLFHRAIVMSGASTAQWELPNDQMELAKRQARVLNCSDANVELIMQCLKSKSAMEIGESYESLFEFQLNPILVWLPVIEHDFGQERFLSENPTKLFRQGRFAKVPIITGITKYEFLGPALNLLNSQNARLQMDTNFTQMAPICFMYEKDTDRSNTISATLRKKFLNSPILDDRSLAGLNDLYNDGVIGFGVHRFARLAHRSTKVYYYQNSYVGRYSHTYYPSDKPYAIQVYIKNDERYSLLLSPGTGTVHHDDLLYLFVVTSVAPIFKQTDPEHVTVERMTRMWASFAAKGDPNKVNDDYLRDVRWRQMISNRLNYLDISDNLVMKDGLNSGRYDTWNSLFPLNSKRFGRYAESLDSNDYS